MKRNKQLEVKDGLDNIHVLTESLKWVSQKMDGEKLPFSNELPEAILTELVAREIPAEVQFIQRLA